MIFSDRDCNDPQPAFGMWWLSQFRRWGMVKGAPDYQWRGETCDPAGHLLGRDEGHGSGEEGGRRAEDHPVRRDVRCQRSGEVREIVPGQQPGILTRSVCEKSKHAPSRPASPATIAKILARGARLPGARPSIVGRAPGRMERLMNARRLGQFLLPASGLLMFALLWGVASLYVEDLPSPLRTWEESKLYLLQPFVKRGEIDQGIALLASLSLVRVAKGFLLGAVIATPLGLLLGLSRTLHRMFDPVIQILRPISPLAWLPLGLILFRKSEPAALFAIAVCSMWPTVINGAAGVKAIPQDYWNVAKVLRLSRFTTFAKIVIPATLPYLFTGYRLSLGIAWLVIVASEMLTGTPGIGGFLWQDLTA